jgi:ubiquitin C-terminal hydrolase
VYYYHVMVKGFKDLESSVQNQLKPEEVSQHFCSTCNSRQNALKEIVWADLPSTMLVVLDRSEYVHSLSATKIYDRFEFPESWDVTKYSSLDKQNENKEPIIYQLVGVLNHNGTSGNLFFFRQQTFIAT